MKVKSLTWTDQPNKPNSECHNSMKWALILAQTFGFFPLSGVKDSTPNRLLFKWLSLRSAYALATMSLVIFAAICQLRKMFRYETNIYECNGLVFILFGLRSSFLFVKLAQRWPKLMERWHSIEISMGSYGVCGNLRRKLNGLLVFFMAFAAIEHMLVQSYKMSEIFNCTRSISDGVRHFFVNATFSHIYGDYGVVDYSPWTAIFVEISNIQMTFCWTYVDVFIILISTAFSARLSQINKKLNVLLNLEAKSTKMWREIREHHLNLCQLCSLLDKRISDLVLLSFASNLYFTLMQLFSTFRPMKQALERVYFSISFGFLILRIVCVCTFAASIYETNNRILPDVLSVPSHLTNKEVERFVSQVVNMKVALTGRKFFKVTRGLVLKIAGAIVTYELVLIQFTATSLQKEGQSKSVAEENANYSISDYWLC